MINHIMKEFLKSLMKSNTNNNNKHNQDCKCLNLYMIRILKNQNWYNTKKNVM